MMKKREKKKKKKKNAANSSTSFLLAIFAAIVSSFVAATVFVHWQTRTIDRMTSDMAENAAPSIEHLAIARSETRQLQALWRDELDGARRRQEQQVSLLDRAATDASRRSLDQAIHDYLALEPLPHERDLWLRVFHTKKQLDRVVTQLEAEVDRNDLVAATATASEALPKAAAALSQAVVGAIELNANHIRDAALEIRKVRTSSTYAAFGLDLVCALVSLVGAMILRSHLRAHADLTNRHTKMQEERASELDQFAGRVAHDILSPLNTIGFALHLADKRSDEQQRKRVLERGTAALERVKRLVTDLLNFARAGGRPAYDERANVERTIADIVRELEPTAAGVGVDLRTECAENAREVLVACSPGVLTSVVANLTRNAIKYIGNDSPIKRVEIRTQTAPGDRNRLRIEIEDTGPGVSTDIDEQHHLFEPYVRASSTTGQPGIGLGLATVKRLVEAHEGCVGVISELGRGSTFWFELPKAGTPHEPVSASINTIDHRSRAPSPSSSSSAPHHHAN